MKLEAIAVSPASMPSSPVAAGAGALAGAGANRKKIAQSARQFEAQLLTSVLASLEKSFGSVPGTEESGVSAQYRSLATQNLASAWAEAGGVGLAKILTSALLKASHSAVPAAALPVDRGRPVPVLPVQALPPGADIGTE